MIAVWYHCILSGGSVPIQTEAACSIMAEQMAALDKSGLLAEADEFYIGVNGDQDAADMARLFVPCPNARFFIHGTGATTEIPTLSRLRGWLPAHPDWLVLYHHIKGVTQPDDEFHQHHRRVMEKAVVANWRTCVKDLKRGYDAVGVNLVHPVKRPVLPGRFFAGNFWWARADYLLKLPPLPNTCSWANRCMAEGWVCSGPGEPRFMDYERPELYA